MATVNINGSAGTTKYQAIMSATGGLNLGTVAGEYKILKHASGYLAGVNVKQAKEDTYSRTRTASNDRSYPVASGYSVLGVPLYNNDPEPSGGAVITNTTWKRDYAVFSGSVTFATASGREKKFNSQFTT